jgi:hypothetical protein
MTDSGKRKDYYAGALCILFGLAVIVVARSYRVGTLLDMGPGYFPMMLGGLMMFIGVLIIGTTVFVGPEPEDPFDQHMPATPDWRGCISITASVVMFIAMANWFGMAPAIFVSVFVAAMGDRTSTIKTAAILGAGVTVFGVILFSHFLKVSMPVFLWLGE